MEISSRKQGEIVAIDIKGIMDTSSSPKAQEYIQELLDHGISRLLINLSQVEYLSSSGLRVLLVAAKKLWAVEGKFKICQPNKIVKEILDTSGFSGIMDVRETEQEAMAELS